MGVETCMNRKEFGKLISSLRHEMGWTQEQLARATDIDLPIISQIERGVKSHFSPQQLLAMADAFQLITLERHEFFLAASGVEHSQLARPDRPQVASDTANAEKELNKIKQLMEQLRYPALLRDPYSDVILANSAVMALFGMNPIVPGEGAATPRPWFNIIHSLFVRSQPVRMQMKSTKDWDEYVVNAMRLFRVSSLRYRAKPYFEHLMRIFHNPVVYPSFERYWKLAYSVEQDVEASYYQVSYQDRLVGDVKFITLSVPFTTAFGELYLAQAQPLNENTERVFASLMKRTGGVVHRFSDWPEKHIPPAPRKPKRAS